MADVTVTYKGSPIIELSDSGSKSIDTAGFFCDANILLNYVKSGGGGGLKYKIGDFTLTSSGASNTSTGITHNLGVVPKCVIVWQDTYDDDNVPTEQVNAGYVYLDRIIDMKQRLTSSASYSTSIYCSFTIAANSTVGVNAVGPSSDSYMPKAATKPTAEKLFLYSTGANNRWRSGVDYHYFVAEGWWETT